MVLHSTPLVIVERHVAFHTWPQLEDKQANSAGEDGFLIAN
jgi:hypothetical protein